MLLYSGEFYDAVRKEFLSAKASIFITSAFIKEKAVESLLRDVSKDLNIEIVGRWKKNDLLVKASDLAVYDLCSQNGWKFGVDQNLHGKLYFIDDNDVFLGSANLTQKGMSIGGFGNIEFGARFSGSHVDIKKIHDYKSNEVVWLDDNLFEILKSELLNSSEGGVISVSSDWSSKVLDILERPIESLWIHELIFSEPKSLLFPDLDDLNTIHDFELLGLHCDNLSEEDIKNQFRKTRLYRWLRYQLKGQSINFGGLTHRLHNSLFDEPLPYRKKIKDFVKIIFLWMEFLLEDFEVTKHNRTYSVVIK